MLIARSMPQGYHYINYDATGTARVVVVSQPKYIKLHWFQC